MGIYVTYEKKLGPGPKNWGRGTNFKMTAKIRKNGFLWKSRISEKSSGPNKNCSSSANFWANDLKSFAFERYELYLCDSSPKLGPLFGFKAQIWVRSQKFQNLRYSNFPAAELCGPRGRAQKRFRTRNLFIGSHMSQLEFWYPMTPPLSPDSGDFRR